MYALRVSGGVFYGPAQMPDSPLPEGLLGSIEFDQPLSGATTFFNNGPEPPNVPGGVETDGVTDGKMSDGTPFNEHVWGGIAEVGRGAMRFMVVVALEGPHKGRELYELQPDWSWTVSTDLALDPGFAEGIVVSRDIKITTGLRWVTPSLQTQQGIPDGLDRAGSLPSGVALVGRLGDYDGDGWLDGMLVGASNVPLGHMFTPGAPVVQTRIFSSDIHIAPLDAALLTVGSIPAFEELWGASRDERRSAEARAYLETHLVDHLRDVRERWVAAEKLLAAAGPKAPPAAARALSIVREQSRAATELEQWAVGRAPGAPRDAVNKRFQATIAAARAATDLLASASALRPATATKG